MTDLLTTLGPSIYTKIQQAKLLIIGAGGIGCELLKNLVLSGFIHIDLIDLDTIDVSNLNRQFLFRSYHVGQSKALVAKEIALSFNPNVKITAYHGNIKSSQFGIEYFQQFQIVFNALDNVDARRHVNRLCLATGKPLIESGTTGYLGQVFVIQKGITECYECTAKVTKKVYPVCTIRSTPDKLVHCIVWAKECYKLLFGKMEDSMLWEDTNVENEENKSAFMHLITRSENMQFNTSSIMKYAQDVFCGLYEYEINNKISLGKYKTATKVPTPLVLDTYLEGMSLEEFVGTTELDDGDATQQWKDRDTWSIKECIRHFVQCIHKILGSELSRKGLGSYVFDKDDPIAMEFVAAAANLRAAVFQIKLESLYNCKGIAGNIIPAIATTNAIVAGIQVLQAFKILQAADASTSITENCSYTLCNRAWDARGVLLNPGKLHPPNPKCYVCSRSLIDLAIDTKQTTLRELIDNVVKNKLGVNEPTVAIGASTIYEEGEDAEESLAVNLDKFLTDLPAKGIKNNTVISIEDFSQDFQCTIRVMHRDNSEFKETATELFVLGGDIIKAQEEMAAEKTKAQIKKISDENSEDEEIEIMDATYAATHKRGIDTNVETVATTKKIKTMHIVDSL